jgi:predicted transcriptional regulator
MAGVFKQEAHTLVERLPDTATWDDLIEQARFHKAVEEGIAAADRGAFASDEEVRRVFAKWGVDVEA